MKDVLSYIYWMYRRESEKGAGSTVLHFHDSLFQVLCQWRTEKASGRRVGSGREKGEIRRACKHCFKNLIPVYQLLVYFLYTL